MSLRTDRDKATAAALGEALAHSFGGCACYTTGFGNQRTCAMHQFMAEVDKRSLPIPRLQRLLFVKSQAQRFIDAEFKGTTPSPTPVDTKGVLPW